MTFTIRFFGEQLRDKLHYIAGGVVALILTAIATTLLPRWLERGIALLKQHNAISALSANEVQALAHIAWVMIGLGLVLGVFRTLSRVLIFISGRRCEEEMRQRYFESLAVLSPKRAKAFETGDLISRGTSDVSGVRVMVAMGILHTVNGIMMLVLCLYHMLSISPLLTLLCMLPAPLGHVLVRRVSMLMMNRSREVARMLGAVSEAVREIFGAHTLIGIYPVFGHLFNKFQKANDEYRQTMEKWTRLRITTFMMAGSLAQLAQWILLIAGGHMVMKSGNVPIESMVAFSAYLALIQDPVRAVTWIIATMQRGEVCLERIYEIIDAAGEDQASREARAVDSQAVLDSVPPEKRPLIEIRGLDFVFDAEHGSVTTLSPGEEEVASAEPKPSLPGRSQWQEGAKAGSAIDPEPFSLRVDALQLWAGKRYGVFGPVGCGKSTLVNILSGNYVAPAGTCFFKGQDYAAIDDQLLRRQFAMAPQESRHFARTIRENIDLVAENPVYSNGHRGFQVTTVDTALDVSCLQPDINTFPKGLDSMLGENGINLSGGQRQRLSVMRSLVKPHQVLVLDDIISSVDHRTETRMLSRLYDSLSKSTCLIFISHRISALIHCDEILFMDRGRIVDHGTHAELLERQEVYRRSFEHQVLEQRIEEAAHVN